MARVSSLKDLTGKPTIKAYITHAELNEGEDVIAEKIDLTEVDFVANSLTFREATSNSGEITVGAAIISSFNFSLWNDDDKFSNWNWTNTIIDVTITVDGVDAYMGYFYIVSHETVGDIITIESLDPLKIMDTHKLYEVGIQWPIDAVSAITALVNYGFTESITIRGLDNVKNIMLYDPEDDTMTNRDAISYIAQMLGKYVLFRGNSRSDSYLYFGWYDVDLAPYSVGVTFDHKLNTEDVTVTGVHVESDDRETTADRGSEGYVINITDNPFITKDNIEDVADSINGSVSGLTFRPGSFTVSTTPKIEAGDSLKITTREEKDIIVLATTVTYKPSNVKESIVSDADTGGSDLMINLEKFIRRVARSEAKKYAGGSGAGGGLSVDAIYKELRPGDWLELPRCRNNELYMLWLIPEHTYKKITFQSTSGAKVEIGTIKNGAFMPMYEGAVGDDGINTKLFNHTVYADDYNNNTSDGFCQAVVRLTDVTGAGIGVSTVYLIGPTMPVEGRCYGCPEIRTGSTVAASSVDMLFITRDNVNTSEVYPDLPYYSDTVLVARGYCPSSYATNLIACDTLTDVTGIGSSKGLTSLECVGYKNTGSGLLIIDNAFENCSNISNFVEMDLGSESNINANYTFSGCTRLRVFGDIVSNSAYINNAFMNCTNLRQVGNIIANTGTLSIDNTFENCNNLIRVGEIRGQIDYCDYTFNNCAKLKSVKIGDITSANVTGLFTNCESLEIIEIGIGADSVAFDDTCFSGCDQLQRLIFNNVGNWAGCNINLADSRGFPRESFVYMMNSMPATTAGYTITLNGTAYRKLTDEDKAIATEKGYLVASA